MCGVVLVLKLSEDRWALLGSVVVTALVMSCSPQDIAVFLCFTVCSCGLSWLFRPNHRVANIPSRRKEEEAVPKSVYSICWDLSYLAHGCLGTAVCLGVLY